jgi:hypothetical protein
MATLEYCLFQDDYYQRLPEASDMSVESIGSIPMSMSNVGNSVSMMSQDSSVGSNNSLRTRLMHPDLRVRNGTRNASVSNSVVMPGIVAHTVGEDMLAAALMDPRSVSRTYLSLFHFLCP